MITTREDLITELLNEFDEKFQWHQNESWVFVNDKGKSKVRSWLVDALLKMEKQSDLSEHNLLPERKTDVQS